MKVNIKKPLRLKNRTKYFCPDKDRSHVVFSSLASYQSRSIKIEGYESRLYWQFLDCLEHDGQTFYYTLTYNDANVPTYLGKNCFDYEDLRYLFTGGFNKQLLRKYGTSLKYFVGAELGDGAGERGLHNNPHYHILFFLSDAHDDRYPYLKIDPLDFRRLVRLYWQGFDESDGFKDYRTAKFGIAREGEHLGLVSDFRACVYVAKYVCKDASLKAYESDIENYWFAKLFNSLKSCPEFHKSFFYDVLYPMFNIPLNSKRSSWTLDEASFIERLVPDFFNYDLPPVSFDDYESANLRIVDKFNLTEEFVKSYNVFIEARVKDKLNEYRNRFCNKCRISHGVGDYALEFIDDKLNPSIKVPSKDGFKNRPISQYYYRKLFTDVYVDKKGSNIRVLNSDGINYKVNKLSSRIEKMSSQASSNLSCILNDQDLFESMKLSDVNTCVSMSFNELKTLINSFPISLSKVLNRYAEYKLVYEDRYFKVDGYRPYSSGGFPPINLFYDYRRFLVPSLYCVSRSDLRLDTFLEMCPEDWLPYKSHSYFLRYLRFFAVLDLCSDYFFIKGDDKNQAEAEAIASSRRFHKSREFLSSIS